MPVCFLNGEGQRQGFEAIGNTDKFVDIELGHLGQRGRIVKL